MCRPNKSVLGVGEMRVLFRIEFLSRNDNF